LELQKQEKSFLFGREPFGNLWNLFVREVFEILFAAGEAVRSEGGTVGWKGSVWPDCACERGAAVPESLGRKNLKSELKEWRTMAART